MYITNQKTFFFDQAIQQAIDHAREVFPLESCGAIIDDEYVRFENMAEDKANSFLIDSPVFDLAYQNNEVQAVIHSHDNDPAASIEDQEQQMALEIPFGIINLVNKSVTHMSFWGDTLPVEPLVRRHFFYGVWDCFSLVRDYFRLKHGITIENIPREYGFWNRGESMFEVFMNEFDVDPVSLDDIRANDVLFYNLHGTRYLNHCGVLQDNGLVLHHFENHVSQEFPITYFQQFINSAFRLRGVS